VKARLDQLTGYIYKKNYSGAFLASIMLKYLYYISVLARKQEVTRIPAVHCWLEGDEIKSANTGIDEEYLEPIPLFLINKNRFMPWIFCWYGLKLPIARRVDCTINN